MSNTRKELEKGEGRVARGGRDGDGGGWRPLPVAIARCCCWPCCHSPSGAAVGGHKSWAEWGEGREGDWGAMATKNKYEYTSTQIVAATCSHCCDATSPLPLCCIPLSTRKREGRRNVRARKKEWGREGGNGQCAQWETQNGKRKCG